MANNNYPHLVFHEVEGVVVGEYTYDEDDDEDYIPPIRSTTRVSSNPSSSSSISVFDVDDEAEQEQDHDRRRTEEGESSSQPTKGMESEGIRKKGESNGDEADGVFCSICMEPWSSEGDHQVSCLPCGHLYGLSCIKRWIQQSKRKNSKCPQCGRKCALKDIIRLYVSRLAIADGEQQKKFLSLQTENEFLKMKVRQLKIASLQEKIQQDKEERLNKEKEKRTCLENVSLGDMGRSSEFVSWTGCSQGQMLNGHNFGLNPAARQGSPLCSFVLEDELVVDGGRIFDMDASNQVLILARRLSGMGGTHVLTKISLRYPYESENISLPPSTKAIRDLHVAPSGRHALFASLGKKLSILSMESNNIVLTYELPAPAWSCSWDLNCQYQLYAGLQNGMLLVFDMRQTARPVESMNGLTCHPVHTIHSLVDNFPLPNGGRTLLTASSIGPCVWRTGDSGERPLLVPEMENQGVCISLAYSPISDDIVASFRPKVQMSNDTISSQSLLSPSPSVLGQGVAGSHVLIKRVGGSCYQNLGSTTANVNDIRMPKSAIINVQNSNPLFAYGDELTRGLSLRELPSLRAVQSLTPNQNPILDVKYASSPSKGLLGCVSENRLQLFSVNLL
ncbi:zinc finger protein [Macleaya cordata]|uniref:RING-type E3 ubiquitin transferase n=1 Tax=Macleaya cordata TaxID=56857 RepID=A0A200Q926_MACCD|nr:zinc finger protein [Macleaya cordata]